MRSLILLLFLVAVCVASLPRRVVAQGGPPLITDDPETPGNGHIVDITEEVARVLGSSEATVRSQVSKARVKAKEFVERYFGRRL